MMKNLVALLVAVVVLAAASTAEAGPFGRRGGGGCNVGSGSGSNGCVLPDASQTNAASATEAARSPGLSIPTKDASYKVKAKPATYYDATIVAELLHRGDVPNSGRMLASR